jgi:hypothetical protein
MDRELFDRKKNLQERSGANYNGGFKCQFCECGRCLADGQLAAQDIHENLFGEKVKFAGILK